MVKGAAKNPSSFLKKKTIRYKANYSKYKWTGGKQGHSGNMCMPPKYQEESLVRF